MRHTRSHTANRRSHHALKEKKVSMCSECGAPKLNHAICLNCGKYNGRVVIDVHAALAKKEKKAKAKQKELAAASK
jgi:large subunit ribosomal protein L32